MRGWSSGNSLRCYSPLPVPTTTTATKKLDKNTGRRKLSKEDLERRLNKNNVATERTLFGREHSGIYLLSYRKKDGISGYLPVYI